MAGASCADGRSGSGAAGARTDESSSRSSGEESGIDERAQDVFAFAVAQLPHPLGLWQRQTQAGHFEIFVTNATGETLDRIDGQAVSTCGYRGGGARRRGPRRKAHVGALHGFTVSASAKSRYAKSAQRECWACGVFTAGHGYVMCSGGRGIPCPNCARRAVVDETPI